MTKFGIHENDLDYNPKTSYLGDLWIWAGVLLPPSYFCSFDEAKYFADLLTSYTGHLFIVHNLLEDN